jgi:putative tricarboxylic transport membrane protein
VASFAGGTIGAILLMIFAPALSTVALLFHSAEYFALMVVGLSAIAAFAGTGQVAKALMMTILGLILPRWARARCSTCRASRWG